MTKVNAGITTSLDGYITGPHDGPGRGLGEGGERLHYWVFGGPWSYAEEPKSEATGADKELLDRAYATVGAVVGGRNTYEAAEAWGGQNPWGMPFFIVTHQPAEAPADAGFEFVNRPGSTGYVVVLIGVVAFVVGCFLPYYDYEVSPFSVSLYRLMMFTPGGVEASVGAFLFLFAGVTTLAWVALAGARGSGDWTRSALVVVVIAWSLTWIGILLGAARFGTPLLVGFWVLLLSVGVVVIGTIMAWVSDRAEVATAQAPLA